MSIRRPYGFVRQAISSSWAMRRRRWMGRQLTPTFVFADLGGYTALTEARGADAAAQIARESGRGLPMSTAHPSTEAWPAAGPHEGPPCALPHPCSF